MHLVGWCTLQPHLVQCFWPARFFVEEATSHDKIGMSEYTWIMPSHSRATWQGYCFILPLRGPTWKGCESCGAPKHDRTGSLWVWCRADQLHLAHRITEEERGDISASMKQRVTPAVVDPHAKPVVWGGCWELRELRRSKAARITDVWFQIVRSALCGATVSAVTGKLNP